jgi:hypothetical protein
LPCFSFPFPFLVSAPTSILALLGDPEIVDPSDAATVPSSVHLFYPHVHLHCQHVFLPSLTCEVAAVFLDVTYFVHGLKFLNHLRFGFIFLNGKVIDLYAT